MDDRVLTIERSFRATPAQVYAAWTDPAVLPLWFGPDGFTCRTHAIDVREGGEWRFDMVGHGMTYPNRHRWTALVPPGSSSDGQSGAGEGRIEFLLDGGDDAEPPKAVVVRLIPEGEGTRLVQSMTFPSPEGAAEARSYGALEKGQETLRKLAAALGE